MALQKVGPMRSRYFAGIPRWSCDRPSCSIRSRHLPPLKANLNFNQSNGSIWWRLSPAPPIKKCSISKAVQTSCTTLVKTLKRFLHRLYHQIKLNFFQYQHWVPTPIPPSSTREKAGSNHWNEEIYSPPSHLDRRSIQPNHIKFRTCSVPAAWWAPPINESVTPGRPLVNSELWEYHTQRINMELDLQSLFGLFSLAETPQTPPPRIWALLVS